MSDFSGTGDVARPDNFAVSGKYERNYAHGEIPCPERISLRRLGKGTSFDRDNDRIISRIGLHDPQAIREAAAKLGGTELQEKSDLSFLFSFLPHIPIKFNLWLPDEEFSASGKILFDASAENDLQIEAAGTAAAICLSLLEKVIE